MRDTLLANVANDAVGVGPSADVDFTTDARPAAIKKLVQPDATALWTQGERFGTIGATVGDHPVEITTFRSRVL